MLLPYYNVDRLQLYQLFFSILVENITKSEAKVEAKLDGIKLYTGTFNLCDEVKQVNLTCPLSGKQYNITVKTKIPEIAPRVSTVAS